MNVTSKSSKTLLLAALLAGATSGSFAVQAQDTDAGVTGSVTDTSTKGPDIEGIISARSGDKMQVTSSDGNKTVIVIDDATRITASGGFLSLNRSKLAATSLLTGLPVSVKTRQTGSDLLASQIELKNKDLKTAAMIHNGTDQRFAEQTAATEALRGRMGDIDKYNVKGVTNVNFDTGKVQR